MRSCDVISGSVMSGDDKSTRQPAAGQRRPRAPQLLQEALCTAPAKPKAARKLSVLPATRQPAAGQRRPRAPQLLQEALCTAPATRKAARKLSVLRLPRGGELRASGAHARRSSSRRLCVLRLLRESQPGASGARARRSSSSRKTQSFHWNFFFPKGFFFLLFRILFEDSRRHLMF